MRYLPFLKAGTQFDEVPFMYPEEVVRNIDGEELIADAYMYAWTSLKEYRMRQISKKEVDTELGLRYNTGKVRFGLIPAHWTRVLAQILTVGAAKYAPRNWEKGLVHSEVLDSLYRHLDAFLGGERYDPETKCHHLGHVAWNALALMTFDLKKVGKADIVSDGDLITMEK